MANNKPHYYLNPLDLTKYDIISKFINVIHKHPLTASNVVPYERKSEELEFQSINSTNNRDKSLYFQNTEISIERHVTFAEVKDRNRHAPVLATKFVIWKYIPSSQIIGNLKRNKCIDCTNKTKKPVVGCFTHHISCTQEYIGRHKLNNGVHEWETSVSVPSSECHATIYCRYIVDETKALGQVRKNKRDINDKRMEIYIHYWLFNQYNISRGQPGDKKYYKTGFGDVQVYRVNIPSPHTKYKPTATDLFESFKIENLKDESYADLLRRNVYDIEKLKEEIIRAHSYYVEIGKKLLKGFADTITCISTDLARNYEKELKASGIAINTYQKPATAPPVQGSKVNFGTLVKYDNNGKLKVEVPINANNAYSEENNNPVVQAIVKPSTRSPRKKPLSSTTKAITFNFNNYKLAEDMKQETAKRQFKIMVSQAIKTDFQIHDQQTWATTLVRIFCSNASPYKCTTDIGNKKDIKETTDILVKLASIVHVFCALMLLCCNLLLSEFNPNEVKKVVPDESSVKPFDSLVAALNSKKQPRKQIQFFQAKFEEIASRIEKKELVTKEDVLGIIRDTLEGPLITMALQDELSYDSLIEPGKHIVSKYSQSMRSHIAMLIPQRFTLNREYQKTMNTTRKPSTSTRKT